LASLEKIWLEELFLQIFYRVRCQKRETFWEVL
jgi:hypothetical protein